MLFKNNKTLVNKIYKDLNIHIIETKRNINANGKKRGKIEEVIITNYKNKRSFDYQVYIKNWKFINKNYR